MTDKETQSSSDSSPFGSDVYRDVVSSEAAENMKQAAQSAGLSIRIEEGKGREYSYKHPLEPKMCEGVLNEGEAFVEIDYGSNPNRMTDFWKTLRS